MHFLISLFHGRFIKIGNVGQWQWKLLTMKLRGAGNSTDALLLLKEASLSF